MAERCTFPCLRKCLLREKGIQRLRCSSYTSAGNCHGFNAKKSKFVLQTAVFRIMVGGVLVQTCLVYVRALQTPTVWQEKQDLPISIHWYPHEIIGTTDVAVRFYLSLSPEVFKGVLATLEKTLRWWSRIQTDKWTEWTLLGSPLRCAIIPSIAMVLLCPWKLFVLSFEIWSRFSILDYPCWAATEKEVHRFIMS